jgi:3D (Asp-Asp-Asp) domain-containing protein
MAIFIGSFQVTAYRSVPYQTRERGYFWTASGDRVNSKGIAVSQDLLAKNGGPFSYGDLVYVEHIGFKYVNDTMNKRITKHLDVWVGTYAEEKAFDKTFKGRSLNIWILRYRKEK